MKSVKNYIQYYQMKWKEHMYRMNIGRIPKQILHYHLRGQRSDRHPMKR